MVVTGTRTNSEMPSGDMNPEGVKESSSGDTSTSVPRPMPSVNGLTTGDVTPTDTGEISGTWTNWESLGGTSLSAPAVTSWGNDRLDIFSIGIDSRLYHKCWNGTKWNDWERLPEGKFTYKPAAISWRKNRLDVFAIGFDKKLYRAGRNGTKWSNWKAIEGSVCIHGVTATSWGSDRIDLFTVGTNSVVYHNWRDGEKWDGWKPLTIEGQKKWEKSSTSICAPAAVYSKPNRIDIFTLGIDNYVYHAWGYGNQWTGWEKMGGPAIHGVAVASRGEDRLDLFTISTDVDGTDNHLYLRSMQDDTWSDWKNLGGTCISAPAAVARGTDRLDTFVIGTRSEVWQKSWSKESSSGIGVQVYTPKTYTHVQYIAYKVPTFGLIVHGGDDLTDSPVDRRIRGMLTDDDERRRVKRFYDVVMAAKGIPEVDSRATTLKIFLAPEFYFKSSRAAAANFGYSYSFNTMQNIMECLHVLFQENAELANWLIVPGSIVSMLPGGDGWTRAILPGAPPGSGGSIYDHPPTDMAYLNTVPVIKGGDGEALFTYVHKRLISGIDGAPVQVGLLENPFAIRNNPLYSTGDLLGSWKENKANIFRIDNITFGLEVCLDHGMEVLKVISTLWSEQENIESARLSSRGQAYAVQALPNIDIHLITSCGMSIKGSNVVARRNGYVIICDGINSSTFPRTQMRKINTYSLADGATFTATDVAQSYVHDLPASLQLRINDTNRHSQVTPQSIVFYNPVPVPL